MKSVLDISVSGFRNYHTTKPEDVSLMAWLTSAKFKDRVTAIRKISDKKQRDQIKATLPAITPSGIFSERKASCLIAHSRLMQFDIDGVSDIQTVKRKIIALSNVAYCGLSVSGRGLWGLIPIAEPSHHKQYFEFIKKAFAGMGIVIDESCKDVSRLRGYSYDHDPYFNHNAKPLNKYYSRPKSIFQKTHFKAIAGDYEAERIEYCLTELNARRIDLTVSYNDWYALGCSFASLGEQGRQYFQAVSQNYHGYDLRETDEQFNRCLKSNSTSGLNTFFGKCRDAGIFFKEATLLPKNENKLPKENIHFPQWYLLHVQALKKRMGNEISNKDYCRKMEEIAATAGLSVEDYVALVNKYDSLYFKNKPVYD